jgi:predicted secreted protein
MDTSPYFDLGTGRLRFWVTIDDSSHLGATITKETLHYRFHGQQDGSDAVAVYQANSQCINDAVRRRADAGAREPIVLRDFDVAKAS